MHLYDPLRPRVNSQLAFATGHVVIPALRIIPLEQGIELGAWLRVGTGYQFSWHKATITDDALKFALVSYRLDPEAELKRLFGWTNPVWQSAPEGADSMSGPFHPALASHAAKQMADLTSIDLD